MATQVDLRNDFATVQKLEKDRKEKPVTQEMGEEMAHDVYAFRFVESSALTQIGLKEVFEYAIEATRQPPMRPATRRCLLI